jgi:hypothetical protein
MKTLKRAAVVLGCVLLLIVVIGVIGNFLPAPPASTTGPKYYKNKLIPDKVSNINSADDYGLVGIMVESGDDGEHFVSIAVPRRDIRQGLHTGIHSNVVTAYNGEGQKYAHSPEKYGTTMELTIHSLSKEKRTATITVSGRLVTDVPGGGPYLEIVPVELKIQGEQFDQLMATKRI